MILTQINRGTRGGGVLVPVPLMGRDSSVGIANHYGLDGPGIESRWGGDIFRTRPDRPWGPTRPPIQWLEGLFRV